jgi:hypothetical protein
MRKVQLIKKYSGIGLKFIKTGKAYGIYTK